MKATIIGQDYLIVIEKQNKEFAAIERGIRLETLLIDGETGSKLDKRVILETGNNIDNPDGIDFEYLPKRRRGWMDIKDIQIRLSPFALSQIESFGRFGTRYDGSNMIDIYNELPKRY